MHFAQILCMVFVDKIKKLLYIIITAGEQRYSAETQKPSGGADMVIIYTPTTCLNNGRQAAGNKPRFY